MDKIEWNNDTNLYLQITYTNGWSIKINELDVM